MTIEEFRMRIDQVDDQLLRLLSVRAQLAIEIGRTKRESGIELYDPVREQEVVRRVLENNPGVLDADALTRLFCEIVTESRNAEEQAALKRAPAADAAGTS
nr:chorismate mutase [Candidatus Acidoferrales bacterium]